MTAIDERWDWLLTDASLSPKTREMVGAARQRIQLARLFPYISMDRTLKFSLTTEWPYSERVPYITYVDPDAVLDGPAYEVRDRDNRPTRFAQLEPALDYLVDRLATPPRDPEDAA